MTESELEALEAQFSEYLDHTMSPEARAAFERRLAESPPAREAFEQFQRTVEALSGLHKVSAPEDFEAGVEQTIHRRSAGRLFGRKAFGDRVPFEVIAVVALAVLLAIYVILRRSDKGSLELRDPAGVSAPIRPEVRDVIPSP